jgi:hypothetical protein
MNRNSSVGIATRYGLDDQDSIPGKGKIFLLSIAFRPALGPIPRPIEWVPDAVCLRMKRQWRKTHHLLPSSAEVKYVIVISLVPIN